MAPVQIEGTEWTVQDWDKQWPAVFTTSEGGHSVEVDKDGDAVVEHGLGDTRVYIPLAVLAEVLRRNGYEVKKNP